MKQIVLLVWLSILMLGAMCWGHGEDGRATGVLAGTVIDSSTREPLIGVSIQLKGTPIGALTDANGWFKITRIPPGVDTFVVTCVGYLKMQVVQEIQTQKVSKCTVSMIMAIPQTTVKVVGTEPYRYWGIFKGIVIDSVSRLPVANAQVKIDFPKCEVLTDSSGRFRLNCAWVGRYKLKISHQSHHTRKLSDVTISKDSTEVEFTLVPKK